MNRTAKKEKNMNHHRNTILKAQKSALRFAMLCSIGLYASGAYSQTIINQAAVGAEVKAQTAVQISEPAPQGPLKAAIFVQNRAGAEYQDKIGVLTDMLAALLSERGFSVLDKDDVIAKLQNPSDPSPAVHKALENVSDIIQTGKSEASVEDAISGASALQIAGNLHADLLIVATLTTVGKETRVFNGGGTSYGVNSRSSTWTARISLKVLEGNSGGSVAGDLVTVSHREVENETAGVISSEVINSLLEDGAREIAERVGKKVERIRAVPVKQVGNVSVNVKANVDGASIEADGAVLGSTPAQISLKPGLHHLRISREYFATWEKTVNVFEGQTLNATLELSQEGSKRFQNIEKFKAELAMSKSESEAGIAIAKEQSAADAKSKVLTAEGLKTMHENSHVKIEGKLDSLTINGTSPDATKQVPGVIVNQNLVNQKQEINTK